MQNKISIGNAGEFFVAAELERHGFTAALTQSNVKDFDILAIDRQTLKQYAIQVKTTAHKLKTWTLAQKNETLVHDNMIYFFVSLNELDIPEYHIVPSAIVAERIRHDHQVWLDTPGKKGQQHSNTTIRKFSDLSDEYLDRWDFLGK